ncbi:MAG: hypothetical protein FK734_16230 [Asgard group archaeon]|nr:hypothetical protein [Asgard group archaeon]
MPFTPDNKKQVMKTLIIASAFIPLYIIYMTFVSSILPIAIFSAVYSSIIVIIWVLFYYDFFLKKPPTIKQTNGTLKINSEESLI